jgi:hypothetical protein
LAGTGPEGDTVPFLRSQQSPPVLSKVKKSEIAHPIAAARETGFIENLREFNGMNDSAHPAGEAGPQTGFRFGSAQGICR